MMSEPGIIGKIGFNSQGIGVLLNFLHIDGYQPRGVPTHILLRRILESFSMSEVKNILLSNGIGRTSNILVSDSNGNFIDIEFAGDEYFLFENTSETYLHTNHYLGRAINDSIELPSSFARYKRGSELLKNEIYLNVDSIKKILLDEGNSDLPICRKYTMNSNGLLEDIGTISSIIMNLKEKEMHITRGNPFDHPYTTIALN